MRNIRLILSTVVGAALSLLGTLSVVQGETLDDFKRAKSESEICGTIPYSSEREKCLHKRDDIDSYCKTDESGCTSLNTYARLQDLDRAKRKAADLDRTRDGLKQDLSNAKEEPQQKSIQAEISATEKNIDDTKRDIEQLSKTIDDQKYTANGRVEKAKRCRETRIDTVEAYDDAIKKAKSETDPEIKSIAADLIDKWTKEDEGHTRQIKETQERLLTCEKAAKGEQF